MALHLLVVSLDDGRADLHTKSGDSYLVPVTWLPEGTREGSALIVETTRSPGTSEITFRVAEGTSEPEGADVGG